VAAQIKAAKMQVAATAKPRAPPATGKPPVAQASRAAPNKPPPPRSATNATTRKSQPPPPRAAAAAAPKPAAPKKPEPKFPKGLVVFVQKCFGELKTVTTNPTKDRTEVHEELKAIIAKAKEKGTLQSTNWEKHPYPKKLDSLIQSSRKRRRTQNDRGRKRQKRGESPTSWGNNYYNKKGRDDDDDPDWRARGKKGQKGQQKGKKGKQQQGKRGKKNKRTKADDQADDWFAEAESENINAARAKRAKRFGAAMLKSSRNVSKKVDWRKTQDTVIKKSNDFESAKITGTNRQVLKDFFRLTREARPNEVRTKKTCTMALGVIRKKWKGERDYRWCENQLKSLRQDLKVQHIRDQLAVDTYELHARICLEVSDFSEYNQCQTALRSLYEETSKNRRNEKEFVVYRILYLSVINDHTGFLRAIGHKRTRTDPVVKLCVRLYQSLKQGNYCRVFQIYKKLPPLAQNLVNQVKEKVRHEALCKITSAFCPQPFPISEVKVLLGFDKLKELKEYLLECNVVLTQDKTKIDTRKSKGKVTQYVAKSRDDEHGITHGSLGVQGADKQQDAETISHFLKRY